MAILTRPGKPDMEVFPWDNAPHFSRQQLCEMVEHDDPEDYDWPQTQRVKGALLLYGPGSSDELNESIEHDLDYKLYGPVLIYKTSEIEPNWDRPAWARIAVEAIRGRSIASTYI